MATDNTTKTTNNIILGGLIGVLLTLFLFYMTDSSVARNLAKESFQDVSDIEIETTHDEDRIKEVSGMIDNTLNPVLENQIKIKERDYEINQLENRTTKLVQKLQFYESQNKLFNTNGEVSVM
jgi:hypothetical protein